MRSGREKFAWNIEQFLPWRNNSWVDPTKGRIFSPTVWPQAVRIPIYRRKTACLTWSQNPKWRWLLFPKISFQINPETISLVQRNSREEIFLVQNRSKKWKEIATQRHRNTNMLRRHYWNEAVIPDLINIFRHFVSNIKWNCSLNSADKQIFAVIKGLHKFSLDLIFLSSINVFG